MSLKDLFTPNKTKITLAVIFAVAFFILALSLPMTGFYDKFTKADFSGKIFSFLINLIIGLLVYYPLSCGVLLIFDRFFNKQKAKSKTADFAVAVLLILVFNPLTLGFLLQSAFYVNNNVINTPCGLEIIEFSQISPSRDAGINAGEVIIMIDDETITNTEEFIHAMVSKKPGDIIKITTNVNSYDVKTLQNPDRPNDAYLGIKFKEKICKR